MLARARSTTRRSPEGDAGPEAPGEVEGDAGDGAVDNRGESPSSSSSGSPAQMARMTYAAALNHSPSDRRTSRRWLNPRITGR